MAPGVGSNVDEEESNKSATTKDPTPQHGLTVSKPLDFEQADRWQSLPNSAQQACRRALALLLRDVASQQQQSANHDYGRKDSSTTS